MDLKFNQHTVKRLYFFFYHLFKTFKIKNHHFHKLQNNNKNTMRYLSIQKFAFDALSPDSTIRKFVLDNLSRDLSMRKFLFFPSYYVTRLFANLSLTPYHMTRIFEKILFFAISRDSSIRNFV